MLAAVTRRRLNTSGLGCAADARHQLPRARRVGGAELRPVWPLTVEQVQQLPGIETGRERVAWEAETFNLDPEEV